MLVYLFVILAAVIPNQKDFIVEDVKVTVLIESNVYKYKITNIGTDSIVGFQMGHHASYYFMAPDGWEKQRTDDMFNAQSKGNGSAIKPDSSGNFSMRISSMGATLGIRSMELKFASGRTVTADVWGPMPEPPSYRFSIVIVFVLILLLHSVLVLRRKKRSRESELTDASPDQRSENAH